MLKIATCAGLLALAFSGTSCRKKSGVEVLPEAAPVIAAELTVNKMKDTPQGLLASRAASPIHWQHWEPEVLQRAAAARRLVFAFIGSAQYPGCLEALDAIERDPALVARLNEEFIPVLVDVDLCRESGLVVGLLCQEIQLPISFPFLLVLSPEGSEVTWRPMAYSNGSNMREMFDGAADVVAKMWSESPDYVSRNSKSDHENRIGRLPKPDMIPASEEDRALFLRRATRQLVSLYDEDIGTLSGTGELLPIGILQCLASASQDPATPPNIVEQCHEAISTFGGTILRSAMIDPLDGGVYSSRRGSSWDLPMPNRTCMTQARAARALVTLHSATADPRALEVALGAVRFAEDQFSTDGGLFSVQRQPTLTVMSDWLWTRGQIDQALAPAEATLWNTLCGIKDLGNLPMEADPMRDFFRMNSLGYRTTLAVAAAKAGVSGEEAKQLLESGRKKLLKARQLRIPPAEACQEASAAPSFRMISAYAALFTATDDPAWRQKAVELAKRSRQAFSDGALLIERNPAEPKSVCDARAFTYALAIQAALDLAEITLDENWRIWAGDLSSVVAEHFVSEKGQLLEVRPASSPLQLPLEDRLMLFDDSTAGLMRMNLARLLALGQTPPPAIEPWLRSLPDFAAYPVIFTDSILATSFARSRIIVELPADASLEWREAACSLPLDRIARRIGTSSKAVAKRPDGSETSIDSPDSLATTLLPPTR